MVSSAPLVTADDVIHYIPHRAPFVLVDTLYVCTTNGAEAGYLIRSNPMMEDGLFTEAGMLEHVAQSVALRAGWLGRQPGQLPSFSMGYIAGIKDACFYRQVPLGTSLRTHFQIKIQFQQLVLIEAVTYGDEQRLLDCQLQLYHKS